MKADAARAGHRHRDHQRLPRFRRAAADLGHEIPRRAPALRRRRATCATTRRCRAEELVDAILCWSARAGREPPSLGHRARSRRPRSDARRLSRAARARGMRARRRVSRPALLARREHGALRLLPAVSHVPRRRAAGAVASELRARRRSPRSRRSRRSSSPRRSLRATCSARTSCCAALDEIHRALRGERRRRRRTLASPP